MSKAKGDPGAPGDQGQAYAGVVGRVRPTLRGWGATGLIRLRVVPVVVDAVLGWPAVLARVEVQAAIVGLLFLLDREAVGVGEGVLPDAGDLPGDLHAGA